MIYLFRLKEEILNTLKERDDKIADYQRTSRDEIVLKMETYDNNYNEISMRVLDLHNITISQKEKIEKINDFQKFQQRTTDHLLNQEIKLSNLQKDVSNACTKYDKHYLDNMIVPGLIGDYCKFRNLKEYFEV